MKCRQVRELMGAYLYGDLSPTEMRDVRLHMQGCSECREDLRERGQIIASLGDDAPALTDDERQSIAWSVQGAIRQQDQEREYSRVKLAPAYAIVLVLALGLVVGSTIGARRSSNDPANQQQVVADRKSDNKKTDERARVEITEERLAQKDSHTKTTDQKPDDLINSVVRATGTVIPATMSPEAASSRKGHNPGRDNAVRDTDPAPVVPGDDAKQVEDQNKTTQLPKPEELNDAQTKPENTDKQ